MKQELKLLLTTKTGWISWGIANIITSLQWAIPLGIGFILNDGNIMTIAWSIYAIGMLPFVPLWVLNIIIALWVNKKLKK